MSVVYLTVCLLVCLSPKAFIFYTLLHPFKKVPGQKNGLQKDLLDKNNKRDVVSKYAILAQKWSKTPCGKVSICLFVAVGNSDI